MLVDNAIVITEGIMIGIQRGMTRIEAATRIVRHTRWPLLGATIIAITAFAPIGLSPDASGEFTGSLFWVLFISLFLSWVFAITLTPFFCVLMFKKRSLAAGGHSPSTERNLTTERQGDGAGGERDFSDETDPYGGSGSSLFC